MKAESEEILMELLEESISNERRTKLLAQLKDDAEALKTYQLMLDADKFIGDMPIEEPSPAFSEGVSLGYKRVKTREKNNRLLSYFLGVVVAAIVLILSFAGDASTALPTQSTPVLDQVSNWVPNWSIELNGDQLIQFVLVLNAVLLIVVIEKIISKRRYAGFYSF